VTALTGRWGSDEDSSDDEVTFEELATTYRKLCHKSAEVCQQVESQKKVIAQLENEKAEHVETISKLKSEVVFLNSKLDEMTKYVRMLNNGTDTLDKIL
jgi:predicted nuclease with TOPRIM domain